MRTVLTVEDVISLWPTQTALAEDLGGDDAMVRMWKHRGRIPGEYDVAIVAAAKRRNIAIDFETLARVRKRSRAEREKSEAAS